MKIYLGNDMNYIKTLNTDYLRASRTIETVLVKSRKDETVVYVYNYEGYSFRVFNSTIKLINFFNVHTNQ